jgi:23S rRNA (pseudouridine1915-N3)-methyltransferase
VKPTVKVFLYYSGKPRDAHANGMAAEYIKRAAHYAPTRMTEIKAGKADPVIEVRAKHPGAKMILLDPQGRQLESQAFATLFSDAEMRGHDLVFVVGGHDGLAPESRERADLLLSLSALTMPHELARAVLAEQIYRAFTILRGHPYSR